MAPEDESRKIQLIFFNLYAVLGACPRMLETWGKKVFTPRNEQARSYSEGSA